MKFIIEVKDYSKYVPVGVCTYQETVEAVSKQEAVCTAEKLYGKENIFSIKTEKEIEEEETARLQRQKQFYEELAQQRITNKIKADKRDTEKASQMGLTLQDYRKLRRLNAEKRKIQKNIEELQVTLQELEEKINKINPVE